MTHFRQPAKTHCLLALLVCSSISRSSSENGSVLLASIFWHVPSTKAEIDFSRASIRLYSFLVPLLRDSPDVLIFPVRDISVTVPFSTDVVSSTMHIVLISSAVSSAT